MFVVIIILLVIVYSTGEFKFLIKFGEKTEGNIPVVNLDILNYGIEIDSEFFFSFFLSAGFLFSSCGPQAPECVGSVVCSTQAL